MVRHNPQKKPLGERQEAKALRGLPGNMHPAQIVAEIWKRGSSIRRLSRQHGYKSDSLKLALRKPWPRAEQIIAAFIGVLPQEIWPERYNTDGTPNRSRGRPSLNATTARRAPVIHTTRAA